jgi:hypothetical protein
VTVHHLKTLPEYFDAVRRGDKTFEVRRNDRHFTEGDRVVLQRFSPVTGDLGDELKFEISYVLHGGQFGIMPGWAVLGLREVPAS